MTVEIPGKTPENNGPEKEKKPLDDNAKKFIIEPVDESFLQAHDASSVDLTVHWLEIDEENDIETKVARKDFGDKIEFLLISKITKNGKRTSDKKPRSKEEYDELVASSTLNLHLEKTRYEFTYMQNGIPYSIKYDKFKDGTLHMLEVDPVDQGQSEEEKEKQRAAFDLSDFPGSAVDVSDDEDYSGYKIVRKLQMLNDEE